jgi:hypothetical protein
MNPGDIGYSERIAVICSDRKIDIEKYGSSQNTNQSQK